MPRAVPTRPLLAALSLALAACTGGGGSGVTGGTAGLGADAIASLPENVWTTRVHSAGVEAVVSNGADVFAVVCDAGGSDPRTVLRLEPGAATRLGEEVRLEIATGAGAVARTVAFDRSDRDGREVLVHAAPRGAETGALLDALARGSAMTAGPARFSLNGSREALATALVPAGCHRF